jgi:hypothetical protein
MVEILTTLPAEVVRPALTFPAYKVELEKAITGHSELGSVLEKLSA